ncbi:pyrroline-5-carboxylate reductase [Cytobacillus sp. FJAT-54145]|uniref:Pyrroline-5-carboxylate reductase n=1 Tax=Cytobacillus spartinae TaxID=3299023 RepID=A0ABW6KFU2_9BACI
MSLKIGFIGCGKMAQAIIEGILKSGYLTSEQIKATSKTIETEKKVRERFNIPFGNTNQEVAEWADVLFLAVKPDIHNEVITEIRDYIRENTVIITIAAGITLHTLEDLFGKKIKAARSMPNTPSLVGEGMTAICVNDFVNVEEQAEIIDIFKTFGKVELVQESLMDSIPAISGSSPAYVYMFIEALADGGVKQGISREKAYKLAAQAVLGAAKMVLETGKHPGELKDEVCTPGGATIEAVSTLEEKGLRAAVLAAMESCTVKTKSLSKD